MKIHRKDITTILLLLALSLIISCSSETQDKNYEKEVVINELMASNATGVMTEEGKTRDWIEIKNLTSKVISLKGYRLVLLKDTTSNQAEDDKTEHDKKGKKGEKKKDKGHKKARCEQTADGKEKYTWKFPDVELKPHACLIVYASKKDKTEAEGELHTNFKLPSKGAHLMLLTKKKKLTSEVKYDELKADESLSRQADGTRVKTYLQTPGFDNDDKGYEAYNALIDKQRTDGLKIWEVKSKNNDWIELKNVSNQPIDLSKYCLTNTAKKPDKWQLPATTLAPGEIYVVDAIGKSANGPSKANFKIKDEESVILTKDGKFIDGACAFPTYQDITIGRTEKQHGFFFFKNSTRGSENTGKAFRYIAERPTLLTSPGAYDKVDSLIVKINTRGHLVQYTTDGSKPSENSKVYKGSILLTKTTTLRFMAKGDSVSLPSKTYTATYFIKEKHSLPIINITVNEGDLYDTNHGIYAKGPNPGKEYPYPTANFWKSWEKEAHVAFYDGKEGFETDCGLMIFGGFSRANDKKSFKLKMHSKYGKGSITYDFFNQGKAIQLDKFVLRAGSQDDTGIMARDEFFTSLMAPHCPSMFVQKYRPVSLYINAKYFGLYYIREKIGKKFVASHLNTDPDSVEIQMSRYTEVGDGRAYKELLSYARSHNLAQEEHYRHVLNQINPESLIDQKLGMIFSSNVDVGNVRVIRSTMPGTDQRWHWVFYDADLSFGAMRKSSYYLHIGNDDNANYQNYLIEALLQNKDFRKIFLERLSYHMHNTFRAKNALKVFDNLIKTIRPEMKWECKRWPKNLTYEKWEKHVTEFRKKLSSRDKEVLQDLRQELNITKEENKKYFGDLGF